MAFLELNVSSQTLEREVEFYAILPENTEGMIGMGGAEVLTCPTLYLLHGLSDDHTIWMRRTSIERYAAEKGIAVIMPCVDRSFYTDMANGDSYWQFISHELPALCRSLFPMLSPRREDTFVAGLSMGGYGALKCALNASETFSCAAAFSAVADIVDCVRRGLWGMDYWRDIFGDLTRLPGSFNDLFAAALMLDKRGTAKPKIYMWCGQEDSLFAGNVKLKNHLQKLDYDVTWEESHGTHSWKYWDEKIQTALDWLPIQKGGR